jgi:hypothetical protein
VHPEGLPPDLRRRDGVVLLGPGDEPVLEFVEAGGHHRLRGRDDGVLVVVEAGGPEFVEDVLHGLRRQRELDESRVRRRLVPRDDVVDPLVVEDAEGGLEVLVGNQHLDLAHRQTTAIPE